MAVGDILEVDWLQSVRGQPAMNVLHYEETEAPGAAIDAAANLGDGFLTVVANVLKDQLSEDWRTDGVYVHRVAPEPGIPSSNIVAAAEAIVGQIASEAIPTTSAAVITKLTTAGGRSGRGRLYLFGVPETFQDAGQLTTSAIIDIETVLTAFVAVVNGPGGDGAWKPVVFSRKSSPTPVNDWIRWLLKPNLGTIRNRRSPARASDA
jgi:hypothetical protein